MMTSAPRQPRYQLFAMLSVAFLLGMMGCRDIAGPEGGSLNSSPGISKALVVHAAPWPSEGYDAHRRQQSPYIGPATKPVPELLYDAGSPIIQRSPIITAADDIVLSLCKPEIVAIHLDGSPSWTASLTNTSNQESSVGVTQGPSDNLYVGIHDCPDIFGGVAGSFYKLTSGGSEVWARDRAMQYHAPAVTSDAVYQIDEFNRVWAYRTDGTPWWDEDLQGFSNGGVTLDIDGNLYLGTDAGKFSGHSLASITPDGNVRWRALDFSGVNASNAVISPSGIVYVLNNGDGTLYSFNRSTGTENWRSFSGSGRANSNSLAIGESETAYFRTSDGVFAINPDGSLKWKKVLPDATPQKGNPILDGNDNVYVAVGDQVFSYDPDGSERWNVDLADVSYLLLDRDGNLYAVTAEQYLYKLNRLPPSTADSDDTVWPVHPDKNRSTLGQDFGQNFGGRTPQHRHVGLDIALPNSVEQVIAMTDGIVVVRCLPPNHPDETDPACPANDINAPRDNHGLQGVVILQHTPPGRDPFYSLYGHLGRIDAPPVGETVVAGQALGITGPPGSDHLHFEIKDRPVLHNPVHEGKATPPTCNDGTMCFWGYVVGNPREFGYHDPLEYLHRVSPISGMSFTVVRTSKCFGVEEVVCLRVGPGTASNVTMSGWAYRAFTHAGKGEEFQGRSHVVESSPALECDRGWIQITRPEGFEEEHSHRSGSTIPDAWICRDFLRPASR